MGRYSLVISAVSTMVLMSMFDAASAIHHIANATDLQAKMIAAEEGLVVLDFTATWCEPCKVNAPQVEKLALDYPAVDFFKVDVDACPDIVAFYNFTNLPFFVLVRKSVEQFRVSGDFNLLEQKVRADQDAKTFEGKELEKVVGFKRYLSPNGLFKDTNEDDFDVTHGLISKESMRPKAESHVYDDDNSE